MQQIKWRFYLSEMPKLGNDFVILRKQHADEYHHAIKVLRIQPGEIIELGDGKSYLAEAQVTNVNEKKIVVEIKKIDNVIDPKLKINVFVCLIKQSCLDWIVEKLAEIGISNIILLISEKSNQNRGNIEKIISRLEKITQSAFKQSKSYTITNIESPIKLANLANQKKLSNQTNLICTLDSNAQPIFQVAQELTNGKKHSKNINIFIGPESGWTSSDNEHLRKIPSIEVSLGYNILRAETAAIYASSLISAAIFQ